MDESQHFFLCHTILAILQASIAQVGIKLWYKYISHDVHLFLGKKKKKARNRELMTTFLINGYFGILRI